MSKDIFLQTIGKEINRIYKVMQEITQEILTTNNSDGVTPIEKVETIKELRMDRNSYRGDIHSLYLGLYNMGKMSEFVDLFPNLSNACMQWLVDYNQKDIIQED